jgi:insulysin
VKKYKNLNIKPDEYCGYMRRHLLMKHRFLMFDCLSALHEISLEDYRDFVMSFRSQLYIEALIQGNFTTNDSKNLMKFLISCWDYIPLPFEQRFMQKSLRLPSNSHVQLVLPNHDPSSSCTSITDYYQFSVADPREQVLTELLTDLMSEPCFDSLRTNKQLGYTVYVSCHNYSNVSGFSINLTTQEHKYSAGYVSRCMNDFIYEFIEQLKSYTNEMFYSHVDSLIDAKEQADVCLEEEVTRNWEMIVNHTYQFNLLEEQVESLEKITKSKFIKWLTRYVQLGVENYRKLTVKIVSQHHMPLLTCELSNVCSSYNEDNTSCPTDEVSDLAILFN